MNIAICDDDPYIVSELEEIVASCFLGGNREYQYETFLSGESLLKAFKQDSIHYQLFLLDIEMSGLNGLQTAEYIRKVSRDAMIIFITSHSELMQEAFEVEAYHFLIKPIDKQKAKQVLLRAINKLQVGNSILQYTVRKQVHTIYIDEIECFESRKRIVIIHSKDGNSQEYYGTLKEVIQKVSPLLFAQAHTSFVVNMDCVERVDGTRLRLRSGMEFPITEKFHKSFQAAYRNFILMRTK